jgi:hypothetical protein
VEMTKRDRTKAAVQWTVKEREREMHFRLADFARLRGVVGCARVFVRFAGRRRGGGARRCGRLKRRKRSHGRAAVHERGGEPEPRGAGVYISGNRLCLRRWTLCFLCCRSPFLSRNEPLCSLSAIERKVVVAVRVQMVEHGPGRGRRER